MPRKSFIHLFIYWFFFPAMTHHKAVHCDLFELCNSVNSGIVSKVSHAVKRTAFKHCSNTPHTCPLDVDLGGRFRKPQFLVKKTKSRIFICILKTDMFIS